MTWWRVTFIQPRRMREHPQTDVEFKGLQFHRHEADAIESRKVLEAAGCAQVTVRRDEW